MKHVALITAAFFTLVFATATHAQKQAATSQSRTPQPAGSMVDAKMNKVDSTIASTKNTFDKGKKIFENIFKAKASSEALVVIPGIEFEDSHLEGLVKAIKDRKEVKKAEAEYNDGTATIRILLKGKSTFDFWSDLPKEVTGSFKMKSNREGSILVEFRGNDNTQIQLARN